MATVRERIDADLKDAMRSKNELNTSVLRMLKSAIKYKEVEPGATGPLDEASILQVIGTLIKQRRDSIEQYVKRLEDLEGIAKQHTGVDKAFAISAGREVRVFVKPEDVSDLDARKMARDIADQIEREMQYPGEIKVNVIRENRVIEYAR